MDSLPFMWPLSCTFDSSIRIPTVIKNDFILGSYRRGVCALAPALGPRGTAFQKTQMLSSVGSWKTPVGACATSLVGHGLCHFQELRSGGLPGNGDCRSPLGMG